MAGAGGGEAAAGSHCRTSFVAFDQGFTAGSQDGSGSVEIDQEVFKGMVATIEANERRIAVLEDRLAAIATLACSFDEYAVGVSEGLFSVVREIGVSVNGLDDAGDLAYRDVAQVSR